MTAIDTQQITLARSILDAGGTWKAAADAVGVSWQRLWQAVRDRSAPGHPNPRQLTETWRPASLDALVGQQEAVALLGAFLADPYPAALLLEGPTGTGKTSAALIVARSLGCDVEQGEFGGLHQITSGDQSVDTVREIGRRMQMLPMIGSGWKVFIVNEADRIHRAAEVLWLDLLEALPSRTVVIFTTNDANRLAPRFADRCERIGFTGDPEAVRTDTENFARRLWRTYTGGAIPAGVLADVMAASERDGQISFRRTVQAVARAIRLNRKDGV